MNSEYFYEKDRFFKAAVRKFRSLSPPMFENLLDLCSNLPQKPTRTTQIRKDYYKLTVVSRAKVSR